jgi:hypothetical protein
MNGEEFGKKLPWFRSQDSAVATATGYGMDGRVVGVRVPVWSRFLSLHIVHAASGAHPASYHDPGVKRTTPSASAEVKKT